MSERSSPSEFDPGSHAGGLIISFDLDGTLNFGDPPGPVAPAMIRWLQQASAVVGSASDRTVLDQRRLWVRAGLEPDFVVVKNHLRSVVSVYHGRLLVHIGDRFADHLEAANARALFFHVEELSSQQWLNPEHLHAAIRSRLHGDTEEIRGENRRKASPSASVPISRAQRMSTSLVTAADTCRRYVPNGRSVCSFRYLSSQTLWKPIPMSLNE